MIYLFMRSEIVSGALSFFASIFDRRDSLLAFPRRIVLFFLSSKVTSDVSLTTAAPYRRAITSTMNANHAVHRQFSCCDTSAPKTGPRQGARSIQATRRTNEKPLSSGENVSTATAGATVKPAQPKAPPRNLQTKTVSTFLATATGILSTVDTVIPTSSGVFRPKSSDNGAQMSGPKQEPKTKSETPSLMTSGLVWR